MIWLTPPVFSARRSALIPPEFSFTHPLFVPLLPRSLGDRMGCESDCWKWLIGCESRCLHLHKVWGGIYTPCIAPHTERARSRCSGLTHTSPCDARNAVLEAVASVTAPWCGQSPPVTPQRWSLVSCGRYARGRDSSGGTFGSAWILINRKKR